MNSVRFGLCYNGLQNLPTVSTIILMLQARESVEINHGIFNIISSNSAHQMVLMLMSLLHPK